MVKSLATLLVIITALMSNLVFAHGPTPQRVDEKIIIQANTDAVWNIIKDFTNIDDWHPMISSIEMPDEITRILVLQNNQKITESLDDLDTDLKMVSYRLLEENFDALPVSFYTISLQVEESEQCAQLTWSGRFYRADTGNFPPDDLNDEAAVKAMTAFAKSGLQGIKDAVE